MTQIVTPAGKWDVRLTETRETATAHVGFGRRGSTPVVLKVARGPGDEWRAGEIIKAFRGKGMVRVLDSEPGAVLLERLVPGEPLAGLSLSGRDDEACEILAGVLSQFDPTAPPRDCPTVQSWGQGFAKYLASGNSQLSRPLVERAQHWYHSLSSSQGKTRLLHGDLQHYNVLSDQSRNWVAIDPKGVIGELEYDLGASLRNPNERLGAFSSPKVIERRITLFQKRLTIKPDRVLAWAYCQAVLSVIWMIEDGLPVEPDNTTLLLARRMEEMVPPMP